MVSLLGSLNRRTEDVAEVSRAVEANVTDTARYRIYLALCKGIGGDGSYAAELLERDGHPGWQQVLEGLLALSTSVPVRELATPARGQGQGACART